MGNLTTKFTRTLNGIGVNMTLDDVQRFLLRYYGLFPEIMAWRDHIVRKARGNGFICSQLGRRLKVSEDTEDSSLYNYPVQATASDAFKLALVYLHEALRDKDARIVHTMHDEIIVEAKSEIAEEVSAIVQKCMIQPFEEMLPNVNFQGRTRH